MYQSLLTICLLQDILFVSSFDYCKLSSHEHLCIDERGGKDFLMKKKLQRRLLGKLKIFNMDYTSEGFPGGSAGKESVCNVGDPGSISG